MKAVLLSWIRSKRLQVGEWLYWRRRRKGLSMRRRRTRKAAN